MHIVRQLIKFYKKGRFLFAICMSSSLVFCSWMGPSEAGFILQEDVMTRKQAMGMLGQGIALNTEMCPAHYAAGLYAVNIALPTLLNQSFYNRSSVKTCTFLLGVVPCDIDLDATSNPSNFIGIYGTVVRTCGLQTEGVD